MPELDLILRGATVVTDSIAFIADIGIADGKIAAISSNLKASAKMEQSLAGFHVFPGVIDSHVHFNEPGRTEWEGIATGSMALVAGGGTLFFDMPLNSHPPTLDGASFDLKFREAKSNSMTDFALWGGLTPVNLESMEELAERGVIGFKAFMSESGIEDFSRADFSVLKEGMQRSAALKRVVAVHAESDTLTKKLAAESVSECCTSIRDYLNSRPVEAELEAIRIAIDLSGETGCALHVVHVSSGAGVGLIAEAKARGIDVTCETCPHYLVLTEEDVERLGAIAKCAPPLRSPQEQEFLWNQLNRGFIDIIGSDHSPAPPGMKLDSNFFKVWGGISGVQHTLPLLLTSADRMNGDSLVTIASMTSFNPARRFSLPESKGSIRLGSDADLAIVDFNRSFDVVSDGLFYRHRQSPYIGRRLKGWVTQTILRGKTIFQDGKCVANPSGNLIKPTL